MIESGESLFMRIDVNAGSAAIQNRSDITFKKIPVDALREIGELINTLVNDPQARAAFQQDPQKFLASHPNLQNFSNMVGGRQVVLAVDDDKTFNISLPEKTRASSITDKNDLNNYYIELGYAAVAGCHLP
jgi:hypothetical protein